MSGSLAAMTLVCFVSLHQTMPLGFRANVIKVLPLFICARLSFALTERQSFYQLLYVTAKCYSAPVGKPSLETRSRFTIVE